MTDKSRGLLIACDLEGKIKTVHFFRFNNDKESIQGKLFIDLFVNESIRKALEFFVEVKKNSASFGWELILKPEYASELIHFGGALIDNGITIFGSTMEVDYGVFSFEMAQIQNEQINIIRALEKEKSISSESQLTSSNYFLEELSRLNNELVDMQRELSKKNIEISQTNHELEKLNGMKDRFFSIISHDLQSPFYGLLGLTEKMANDINIFTQAELSLLSKEMHNNAKNIFRLLVNLLEWARFQQGEISFTPKEIRLSELVTQNIDLLVKWGNQKGIDIIQEISNDFLIYADEAMLHSTIRNLLSNAIKYTMQGGTVKITAQEIDDGMLEISITDSGIGMPESISNKLFKMEEQSGRKGTAGEKSTGLGLLLCKEFVERNGGRIWLKSQVNIGSTFCFSLPLVNKITI